MHIEILTEDRSGQCLIEHVMPKLAGPYGDPHTWRCHGYRGLGRIPKGLSPASDPSHRILLAELPRVLRGYQKTPGVDAVVIVLDTDQRDCAAFLGELLALAASCDASGKTMFRLAVEEMEAWYLGDHAALLRAYPRARKQILNDYIQDSVCGTWEKLADVIHPGGAKAVRQSGWPLPGQLKHEWANRIGPFLEPDGNHSPSFGKFRDGLRRLFRSGHAPSSPRPP